MSQLCWLPEAKDWRARLRSLAAEPESWAGGVALARMRMDFLQTRTLDETMRLGLAETPHAGAHGQSIRMAVLGSATNAHLHAAIRVAGLRRDMRLITYENDYGQYLQELLATDSDLHAFKPTAILFAFDSHHVTKGLHASLLADDVGRLLDDVASHIGRCWLLAREAFGCAVLQQTVLDGFPPLLGNNEHRLPAARSRFVARLNERLREMADARGVDLVAIDEAVRRDGLSAWHDPALWHRSKQEIRPAMSASYGELVVRVIAARLGRSAKCLVLDLDNTLWGGTIGDDGLDGIVIGQGSALGEGFLAVQEYAKALAQRGIILAVCSKNDHAAAIAPFEKHPDMVLRMDDIAVFRANWDDKAANIRAIAETLNIGLDSLVFLDDNPFERELVRSALPMVAVPEVPDDEPALVPGVLAAAGYFESVGLTAEDHDRTAQYRGNRARDVARAEATDLKGYLRGLEMRLVWSRFEPLGRQRVVQLANKTNQFNLTTRRTNEAEIDAIIADPDAIGLQFRLLDRFGDNGIIALVIGRMQAAGELAIETWLMSCRVLGRQVEQATLDVLAGQARALDAKRLIGQYIPSDRNGMVRAHYEKLGFTRLSGTEDGGTLWALDLAGYQPVPVPIATIEGA